MKNIMVTGGAGFIGSEVIRQLINNTDNVVCNLDKLTYAGNLASLSSISSHKRYQFAPLDICNAEGVAALIGRFKPDVIMHLAAESHVDRSIAGPAAFIHTNIVGTYQLLEAARRYWSELEGAKRSEFRFHHVSTDEVFGDLGDTGELFTELTSYAPSSPYSASKASSDHLVRAWHRTYGLPIIITNCSNNYGPYHFPEKFIPRIILNAVCGEPLPVFGEGQQIRDWLYVEDHARALLKTVFEGEVGETYNIGGHNELSNIEVVKAVCATLSDLLPVNEARHDYAKKIGLQLSNEVVYSNYLDMIKFVPDRPGHDVRYAIDASKIYQKLGWQPQETFESGLRKTIEWYLEHPDWWLPLLQADDNVVRYRGESHDGN